MVHRLTVHKYRIHKLAVHKLILLQIKTRKLTLYKGQA